MRATGVSASIKIRDCARFDYARSEQIKLLSLENQEDYVVAKLKQEVCNKILTSDSLNDIRLGLSVEVKRLSELTSCKGIIFNLENVSSPIIINELLSPLCGLKRNLGNSGMLVLCSLNPVTEAALQSSGAGKELFVVDYIDKAIDALKAFEV